MGHPRSLCRCQGLSVTASWLAVLLLVLPSQAAKVRVEVNIYKKIGNIAADFVGMAHEWNVAWQLGHPNTIKLLRTMKDAEPGGGFNVRMGGLTSDDYGVNPKKYKQTPFTRPPTPVWDYLRRFQKEMNVRFEIGVDFFHQSVWMTTSQISEAMRNLPRGSIIGYELGNEPQYYTNGAFNRRPRKQGYATKGDPSQFLKEVARFYPKVICRWGKRCRGIPIIGLAWGSINLKEKTLRDYLKITSRYKMPMVTVHWYSIGGNSALLSQLRGARAKASYLLSAEDKQPEHEETLRMIAKITHKARKKLRIGESNSISDCGGKARGVTDGFVAALWTVEMALRTAANGADGINFQQAAGCGYAAFGMDIFNKQWVTAIHPTWLSYRVLHAYIGRGLVRLPAITANNDPKCRVWPARDSHNGEIRVITINKNGGKGCTAQITFNSRWLKVGRTRLLLGASLNAGISDITWAGQRYTKYSGGIPKGNLRIITTRAYRRRGKATFNVWVPPSALALTVFSGR